MKIRLFVFDYLIFVSAQRSSNNGWRYYATRPLLNGGLETVFIRDVVDDVGHAVRTYPGVGALDSNSFVIGAGILQLTLLLVLLAV